MSPFSIIPSSFFNKPWHRFKNGAGEEIPAYAILRITGTTEIDNDIVFTVAKPNSEEQPFYLVNGPLAVKDDPDAEGRGTTSMQAAYVLVGGGPVYGDLWGPTDDSWEASENGSGFLMLGAAQPDPTRAVAVQVNQSPVAIATANLTEDMCGTIDEEIGIDNFVLQAGTMPGATPTTAINHFGRQGQDNMLVELHHYAKNPTSGADDPHWIIAIPQMRKADHTTRVYWKEATKCIMEEYYEDAALESCKELQEREVRCADPCVPEE